MSLAMAITRQWSVNVPVPVLIGTKNTLKTLAALIGNLQQGVHTQQLPRFDVDKELVVLGKRLEDS
jgi:hypothetical protein